MQQSLPEIYAERKRVHAPYLGRFADATVVDQRKIERLNVDVLTGGFTNQAVSHSRSDHRLLTNISTSLPAFLLGSWTSL